MSGREKKNTLTGLIFIVILSFLFAVVMGGNIFAGKLTPTPKKVDELIEPPPGGAPCVDAIEIEQGAPIFKDAGEEPEMLRPNHPPIDQIPPMPMPQDTPDRATSDVPGSGIIYIPETGKTIVTPNDDSSSLEDSMSVVDLVKGGGYNGADGSQDLEELPMIFNDMYKINNTGDSPWRMNVKIVMRFGTGYAVCSGTMRDAETVLTAGHCVYDYGGYGWADEIWVYPGYDGDDWDVPPPYTVGSYGWGHGTYFGSWSGWTNSGDLNYDVGIIGVTRAVGTLTGWFSWAYGGSCDWHLDQTYHNASYPAEDCGTVGLHNGLDMYYWYGNFDSCPSWNRLQIDTSGGCFNAGWGGMSGSGAYYIDGDNRYVHGIASTSDRSTWVRYSRQFQGWVEWCNNTFIPNVRGSTFDLQALDVNAEPTTIEAGSTTTVLNHLATNPTNGSSSSSIRTFRVYLSSNDDISMSDTLLSTQNYTWSFDPMQSVRVNMVQVTIPSNTPPGDYFIGVIYDSSTDSNYGNNDTSGWDAAPITVVSAAPSPLEYNSVNPCRLVDTRISEGGSGPIPSGTQRNFVATGVCGVPKGTAKSIMANIVAVNSSGGGYLTVWAYPESRPTTSVLNYGSISGLPAIANGVIVPICNTDVHTCTYDFSIYAYRTTDVVVDVTGYFSPSP